MRRLGHLLIVFIMLAMVYFFFNKIDFSFLTLERDKSKQSLLEMSSFSIIHRPVNSQWLEFSLNQASNSIRLLTNAAINEKDAGEIDANWRYAIEYQLIDTNDQVINQQIYYHRSKINWIKNQQGHLLSQSFFLNNDLLPSSGSDIVFKTTTYPALSKIRIRIHSKSPEIQFIFFRLYEQKQVADNKIDYLWQRMNQEEREKITRYSVYGTDFLRDSERYQMLKYRWRVIGPNGIAEKHYQTEKLYTNKDESIIPVEEEFKVDQIDADKYFYHTIPIPEQGGLFSMEIKPMAGELNPYSNQITINWFGKGRFKRQQMNFNLQQGSLWEKQLQGGLLEIRSEQPVTIRSWLTTEGDKDSEKQEITPDNVFIATYSLTKDQTLDYAVEHINQQSTQLKITIRALLDHDEHSAKNIKLNYSYYRQGKKISAEDIKPELVRSVFDRILNFNTNNSFNESLSEPYDYYLNVPVEVDEIILTSNQPVLVNLANRPASFYKRTRVPEDYYKIRDVKHFHPLWFALQTKDQLELLHQKRRIIISRQSRPPEDEEIISFSNYEWQAYFPVANWQARYLFNPRNNDLPVNEELLHLFYHAVPTNRSNSFNFTAVNGASTFEPSLIFLRKSKKISIVKVFIDGKLHLERPLISTSGQFKLSAMKAGRHDIRIMSESSISWFINHSKVQSKVQLKEQTEYYIKRLSTQIKQQELNFDFDKNKANMILSGLFQSRYGASERTLLQVSISPDKRKMKHYGYTLLNRQFDIRPDNTQAINVLNTSDKYVGAGQRFFIPLGEDLPIGKYRIKLQLLEGEPGYISLYTLDFGQVEKYHFFKTNFIDEEL